ncbi:hypothetical protein EZS27_041052 [termite gut metagenome]|uniref:Uncharacterized protein n=1 Tax=termite gut metagenome TaxID=433724 RepID=A0A5J4PE96_9ZZZZ
MDFSASRTALQAGMERGCTGQNTGITRNLSLFYILTDDAINLKKLITFAGEFRKQLKNRIVL